MEKTLLKKIMAKKKIGTRQLANKTGIWVPGLYLRLWGIVEFTLDEINKIARELELSEIELAQIFFWTKSFLKETKGAKGELGYFEDRKAWQP